MTMTVKMLLLDGPDAGKVIAMPRLMPYVTIGTTGAGIAMTMKQVAYMPQRYMFGARTIIIGCCDPHDRRELEILVFDALASAVAKEIAGPLPQFVCDHQADDIPCHHGCNGI